MHLDAARNVNRLGQIDRVVGRITLYTQALPGLKSESMLIDQAYKNFSSIYSS
jgi:hypothetical protein